MKTEKTFCKKCGEILKSGMYFCPKCGAETSRAHRAGESRGKTKNAVSRVIMPVTAAFLIVFVSGAVIGSLIKNTFGKPEENLTDVTAASDYSEPEPETDITEEPGDFQPEFREYYGETGWKEAFADYLRQLYRHDAIRPNSTAYVTDLDGNGIPEIIGGIRGALASIVYFDIGSHRLFEVDIECDTRSHSTYMVGDNPNLLFIDPEKSIIVYKCWGRNEGTIFNKGADIYEFSESGLNRYDLVRFHYSSIFKILNESNRDELVEESDRIFNEEYEKATKDFNLIDYREIKVSGDALIPYLESEFDFKMN